MPLIMSSQLEQMQGSQFKENIQLQLEQMRVRINQVEQLQLEMEQEVIHNSQLQLQLVTMQEICNKVYMQMLV